MWRVPYLGLMQQYENQKAELDATYSRIMAAGDFILRADVEIFEGGMAQFLQVPYVIGVASGSDALRLAVLAAAIGEADEVITVQHTFHATHEAIVHAGGKPVFVPIADDMLMDVTQLQDAITPRTKAILPVNLNGRMCDMDFICEIARKHRLAVIEDSAQSLGAAFRSRKVWGTACFSTAPMKILSGAGDGGFVATHDRNIADAVRLMRNHCSPDRGKTFQGHGFNSRLDNLQAAILNVKRKKLAHFIERRRIIAKMYDDGLCDLQLTLPPEPSDGEHFDIFNSYVVRSPKAPQLLQHLRDDGIEAFSHLDDGMVSLPIYPEMTDVQVGIVKDSVREFHA